MTRKRRNALNSHQMYDIMKSNICEHINKENFNKKERNLVSRYFVCNDCQSKIVKYSNPKNLLAREIGLKLNN